MKFLKSLKVFLVAILIIGIATPISTEAASIKNGNLLNINKTVSNNAIVKGGVTDVTLSVKGTPQDSTFVKPNDVILIIDKSGSMQADNRINAAKDAAKEFIDLMDLTKHEVGIVDYSTNASSFPLTTDKNDAKAYVDTIQLGGSTNTSAAIREATATLANHRSDAQPTIVIMTDGEANNTADALSAAKAAKDAGITFYTIALLSPNEDADANVYNQLLKEMASSFDHHHFVLGSVGLSDVYKAIVEEIGLASAYNVKITDTISPEFELVPGSYDHHIPRPTVTGNTIEWNISELKTNELSFTYQIRAKDDATAGKYPVAQTSTTFETGDGTTYSLDSTNPIVEIKNHAPIITSITDDRGITEGGEAVTIIGQNFLPGAKVYFGSKLATIVSESETELVVTTPIGSQGSVVVKVENTDRQFATGSFNYYTDPTITSISPPEGPLEGGNRINVYGTSFLNGAIVYIDDVATETTFTNSGLVRAIVPPASEIGSVTVKVVNPDQSTVELLDGYTYLAPPPPPQVELISLSSTSGALDGGESIILYGKNFDPNVKAYFGDQEAIVTSFLSSSSIRVTVPEGIIPSLVTVKVVNPSNTFAELADAYEYLTPPPKPTVELERLSVTSGDMTGGNTIIVYGQNFERDIKVYFADQEATVTSFLDNKRVRIRVPESTSSGYVTIKAENPDGSTAELANGYEYLTPPPPPVPEVTSLSEDTILIGATKNIIVYGKNLTPTTQVFFGDQESTAVTYLATNRVRAAIPVSSIPGSVDVKVIDIEGQVGVLSDGFTYLEPVLDPAPVITSLSSSAGPMLGKDTVTISGHNFQRSARVYFGDNLARVRSVSDTEIVVETPVSAVRGLTTVKVINPDDQEVIVQDAYLYEGIKPTITRLSVDSGAAKGGYTTLIYGTNFNTGMKVTVGGNEVDYTYFNAGRIRIRVPAGTPGVVDIVIDIDGETATIPFTYN